MFQVKQLTITHKKDLTTLVEDLSFSLLPGDRAALIGEEGNGKSTLLRLLADPALVSGYADWTGQLPSPRLRRGDLAQELSQEELALPVDDFCCRWAGFSAADPRSLSRAGRQTGLPLDLFYDGRPMATLSGGERVKLRLALLLLEEPDILLLDEPSNDLDLATLRWLESFLLSLSVPVLFVSHDEGLLEHTANLIIHLERLRRRTRPRSVLIRSGYRDYVARRSADFDRQSQQARKEERQYQQKMDRYRQIRSKVEHQQATISRQDPHGGQLLKKKMHAVESMGRRFEREREQMTQMPEWEEAIVTFFDPHRSAIPAGKEVLRLELPRLEVGNRLLARNLSLHVIGPERIGVIGPNGVGKSTLLKEIAQHLLPRQDLRCAYMPQDYGDSLAAQRSPVEILAPSGHREEVTRARTLLGAMKYKAEEMEHPASGLSGGQRAKLLFLSMVLAGSNVLLLDEPTRNFSPLSAPVIRRVLADFPGTIISVSHDRVYLRQVCTRLLELTPEGLREVGEQ